MLDPAMLHIATPGTGGLFAPVPPVHAHVGGKLSEYIFSGVNIAVFTASCVYAIVHSIRARTWVPVLCMIGGALCVFTEPMVDSHLQVWWPMHYQGNSYVAWGRHVPLMVIAVVGWYFGLGTYVRWAFLQKFGRRMAVWIVYLGEVAAAICLEPAAIQLHLWEYYGTQGIRLFGYPIWWPFVGGACGVVAGTLVYKLVPQLKGFRLTIVPVLIPMGICAVYWGAGLPMFNQLNIAPSASWITYLCEIASVCLAVLIVWICTIATGHHEYRLERKAAKAATVAAESVGRQAVPSVSTAPDSVEA